MKVAVIGSSGQLGTDVCAAFEAAGHETFALSHDRLEITAIDVVHNVLGELKPDLLVNTSAMHHVERCEQEPAQAFAVNAVGARHLASHCGEANIPLMHVSTDYVFDGAKGEPYEETDLPRPLNVYGNTKLSGEHFIQAMTTRHFIVRTSGLYGRNLCRGKGPNFVEQMLNLAGKHKELRVVDCEILTPTSTRELARLMVRLANTDCYGLIHATAEGSCSWYEFTREIFHLAGVSTTLMVAGPDEFPVKVPRPSYSVLANRRLNDAGLNTFRPWRDGLQDYLGTRKMIAV